MSCEHCEHCAEQEAAERREREMQAARRECKASGHLIRHYETGGQVCTRCWETLAESTEQAARRVQFEREMRGMSVLELMTWRVPMPTGSARIVDLHDPLEPIDGAFAQEVREHLAKEGNL